MSEAKVETCPCCGAITTEFKPFTGTEQKIFEYLRRRRYGATRMDITNWLYADDPNGGPMWNPVAVHICRMRKSGKLAALGLTITSTSGTYPVTYTLTKLEGPR